MLPPDLSTGRCYDVGDDRMFPSPTDKEGVLMAVMVCIDCPVLEACGQVADEAGERHGVWGGRLRTPSLVKKVAA